MKLHRKELVVLLVLVMMSSIAPIAPNRSQHEDMVQLNIFVEIDGVVSASFTSVEGLESTTEAIEFREGIWTKSARKIPGNTSYSNIILKRVFTFTTELWKWRKKVADGKATKMFVPYEASGILGSLAGIGEIMKNGAASASAVEEDNA